MVQRSPGILGGMWPQVPPSGGWLPPPEWGIFYALLHSVSRGGLKDVFHAEGYEGGHAV